MQLHELRGQLLDGEANISGKDGDAATFEPYSEHSAGALRQLIHFILAEQNLTQGEYAERSNLSRNAFSAFMNRKCKLDGAQKCYQKLAKTVLNDLRAGRSRLPVYMSSAVHAVYNSELAQTLVESGPGNSKAKPVRRGIIRSSTVLARNSGYPQDDNAERVKANLHLISGLSALVRPANETVEGEPGVSLSIVNMIPIHVEAGDYHPVFKIRQVGAKGGVVDIEGVILAQADRVVLTGRDSELSRNVVLSVFYNSEVAENYRSLEPGKKRRGLSGVMLGLSSQRAHFTTLFRMYAIPESYVPAESVDDKRILKKFELLYEDARTHAGVYTEAGLEAPLKALSITKSEKDIHKMLKQASEDRIFSIS